MTVCNMSIEAGALSGLMAPDETTFAYLEGRPYAPRSDVWPRALAFWAGTEIQLRRTLRPRGDGRSFAPGAG